jgi:uncharacterized membrane protein YebE (DUF533 family)
MILELVALAGLAVISYAAYKHYTATQVIANVKAEVAKLEGEVSANALTAEVKTYAVNAIARLKALL